MSKKDVLCVLDVIVEGIFGDGDILTFEVVRDFVDTDSFGISYHETL
jgi:hypothetical protein